MPSENTGGRTRAANHIAALIGKTTSPGGLARLTLNDHKLLFAVVLASIVPADRKVRDVELLRTAEAEQQPL
jgi:hypothetical protein